MRVCAPWARFSAALSAFILNPIIVLLFAAALVIFLYGVVEFLGNPEDTSKKEAGRSHMLWGVVGLFIMMSVFTIMRIISNTIGAKNVDIPSN